MTRLFFRTAGEGGWLFICNLANQFLASAFNATSKRRGDMAEVIDKTVKLQVAAARQEESGNGFARVPKSALAALGLT